jgi:hypothetical protein
MYVDGRSSAGTGNACLKVLFGIQKRSAGLRFDWGFYLKDEETILADMGYASWRVLTKWKRTQGSTLTRALLKDNAVSRILVENLFAWTGSFAICSQKLRYKTSNNGEQLLFKHNRNHVIICGILNRFSSLRKTPNRS